MPNSLASLLVLLAALAWDWFLGEPPVSVHPVVWMGRLVEGWKKVAPRRGRLRQLLYGLLAVLVSVGGVLGLAGVGLGWWRSGGGLPGLLLEVYLLKGCFSIRMLAAEGHKIGDLLKQGNLGAARYSMRSLVSRDTSALNEEEICGAAIESVTENSTDSVVAPLCFYLLLGVPGVLAYRMANTFDSMIGYRGQYEYLGKAAARLDDILNFLPARLTALLLVVSAPLYGGNRAEAWRIVRRDHAKTASPNAGWTMAAMAGALEVRLVKVGHYALGDPARLLQPGMIGQAIAALYIVSAEVVGIYASIVVSYQLLVVSL